MKSKQNKDFAITDSIDWHKHNFDNQKKYFKIKKEIANRITELNMLIKNIKFYEL